jgi:4-amino-4-deoxy-L-arabinose transferase-like glycosyltransferase
MDQGRTEAGEGEEGKMAGFGVPMPAAPAAAVGRSAAGARVVAFHVAWLLPCFLVYMWFFSAQFQGLRVPDAMDAAQVARHISDGDGFATSFVRPLSLAKVQRVAGHPDLYNAPLYPLALAVAFNLFGPNDRAVGLVSALFGFLTVIVAYLLGARLLDRRAGVLAALLTCFSIGLLNASVSGANVTLAAFLITLMFYLILVHRGTLRWSILCGAICGLAYLTEYGALLLALPAAALIFLGQRSVRWRHVGLFAVGFVVVNLPWMIRNGAVTGSPFGTLKAYSLAMYGTSYPLTSVYRLPSTQGIGALPFLAGHYREVGKKLLMNLGSLESSLPGTFGLCLLPLLGLALFLDLGSAGNRLKWALVAGMGLVGISLAIGQPRLDLFYAVLALVAALGAAALLRAVEARGLSARIVTAAIAFVLVLSLYPIALTALPGARPAKPDRRNLEYLGRALAAKAVVITDQPWAVAWYANRTAVWIPQAPAPRPRQGERMTLAEAADVTLSQGFKALARRGVKADAIYLSSELASYRAEEAVGRWQLLHDVIGKQLEAAQRGQAEGAPWVPPGWTLAASLPPRDFLLVRADAAAAAKAAGKSGAQERGQTGRPTGRPEP